MVAAVEIPGYVVGAPLGAGGFGQVFRAHHAATGRDVAIKVLHPKYSADPAAVGRFVAEVRAVARISHPGIVEIHELGELADGRQFCAMELLHGATLRDLLRRRGPLPLAEALPILRAIAGAVDAAHAAGIAHRDLKPENVFVGDAGEVKLIDFGLAKLSGDGGAPITATGTVIGTPLYMAPEQCRGRAELASDRYAFGALAFHVLTGRPPFAGTPVALALQHLDARPPRASTVTPALPRHVDRVLAALLAKDPAQRPAPLVVAVAMLAAPRRPATRWLVLGAIAVVAALVALLLRAR